MANIKASEISSILQMQLQNMSNKVQFEEIGKVLQVSDGVAHVYGLDKVQSNELVEFENGTMGVVLNLEEDNVGVVIIVVVFPHLAKRQSATFDDGGMV